MPRLYYNNPPATKTTMPDTHQEQITRGDSPKSPPSFTVNPQGTGAVLRMNYRELNNPFFKAAFEKGGGKFYRGGPVSTYMVATNDRSFWESPQRVGRYYQAIKALPDGTKAPSWLDPGKLQTAYDYYQAINDGKPWWMWNRDIADGDPAQDFLRNMPVPEEVQILERNLPTALDTPLRTYRTQGRTPKTYDEIMSTPGLPWWQYAAASLFMTGAGRIGQMGAQGVLAGMQFGPAGALAGGALMTGAGAVVEAEQKRMEEMGTEYNPSMLYKGTEGAFIALNWLYESANKTAGFLAQLGTPTAQEALDNPSEAWRAGKYSFQSVFATYPLGDQAESGQEAFAQAFHEAMTGDYTSRIDRSRNAIVKWTLGYAEPEIIEIPGNMGASEYMLTEARRMLMAGASPAEVDVWARDTFGFGLDTRDLLAGFLLDPLDRISPAATGIVHGVARAVGNEPLAVATGRFSGTQAIRDYGQQIRNLPPEQASKFDPVSRMIAGVDAQGKLKAYTPLDKAPKLWELDNKSRAAQAINTVADGIGVALANETDPNQIYRIISAIAKTPFENAAKWADENPLPQWFNGTEAQVIPNAIRDQLPAIKEMVDNYNITRDQARIIQNMADAMGVEPERLMADYRNATPQEADNLFRAFLQSLDDHAKAGNKQAQILRTTLPGRLDSSGVKKIVDLFGTDGAPFRAEEFKYRTMVRLLEGADEWAAKWFDVKPAGWFQRLSGVVKQAQGYLLLGFNPTYLFNNVIDNMVKMGYEGVLGMNSSRSRMSFLRDLGIVPTRLRTGMSASEIGDINLGRVFTGAEMPGVEIGKAVRKASEQPGPLHTISQWLHKGDRIQAAAQISRNMEVLSSEIAMTTAMRLYWERFWRGGVGFDHVPKDLALALDAYQPGMARRIETAISRGKNRAQIEAEVFNNWEIPGLKDVLTPDEYSTLSAHMPDVYDRLDADIRNAKTPIEVEGAFSRARNDIQKRVGEEIRSGYEHTVETARQKAEIEGVAGVLDTVDDIQRGYGNFWLKHFERAGLVAEAAAKTNNVQASAMWIKFFEQEDRAFRQYRNIHGYKWLGTFKGLGADDPVMAKVLWLLGGSEVGDPKLIGLPSDSENIYTIWTNFFDERRRLMVELQGLQAGKAQPENAARIGEINKELNDLYVESVLAEDLAQTRIDDLFGELYETQLGDGSARQWRVRTQAIRRKMAAAEIMWRQGSLPDRVLDVFGKDVLPDKLVTDISKALLNKKKGSDPFHQEIYPAIIREWMDARNGTVLGEQPAPTQPTPQTPEPQRMTQAQPEPEPQPAPEITGTERSNWIRQAMSDGGYKAPQHMWNSLRKYLPEGKYDALERVPLDELRAAFEKRQVEKAKAKRAKPVQEVRTEGAETRKPENELLRQLIDQELKKAEALGMTMDEARRAIFTDERGSGALNLRAFERDMAGMAARGGQPVVGFLDLRGLGKTNKTHGDAVGDAYIRTVVQLAQEQGLTIYRKGGDEFLVLGESDKALRASLDELSNALDDAVIEVGDKSYVGARFHYGTGSDIATADAGALEAMRADPMAEQFASKQYALQEMGSDALKEQAAQLEANATAIAPPRFSGREAWAQELTRRFGQEQADAQMVVMDRFAELYARKTMQPASEWYNQVLLEGGEGAPEGGLFQFANRENNAIAQRAIDHFGTTNNIREAGYILPDGTLLDFSGRHYSTGYTKRGKRYAADRGDYLRNSRNVDHREIPDEILQTSQEVNYHEPMLAFMRETGAIRIDYASGLINTNGSITNKQAKILQDWFSNGGWIEVDNPQTGQSIFNQSYGAMGSRKMRALLEQINDVSSGRKLPPAEGDGDTRSIYDKMMDGPELWQSAKGATYWTDQGQAVIRFFKGADISTGIHEVVHAYTPFMDGLDSSILGDWYKAETGNDAPLGWHIDPVGNRDVSEYVSRGFEKYLADGPTPEMRYPSAVEAAFSRIKDWLVQIYRSITGSSIDLNVSEKVRVVFDKWMGGEIAPPEPTPEPVAPEPSVYEKPGYVVDVPTKRGGKFGYTKEQVKYIASRIQEWLDQMDAVYRDNPEIADVINNSKDRLKLPEVEPLNIEVPGGVRYKINNYESALYIYKTLTGENPKGFEAYKVAAHSSNTGNYRTVFDWKSQVDKDVRAAIRLYGTPGKAADVLSEQITRMTDAGQEIPRNAWLTQVRLQEIADILMGDDAKKKEWAQHFVNESHFKGNYLFQEGEPASAAGMPVGTVDSVNPMPMSEINYEGYLNTIGPMLDKAEGGLLDRFRSGEPQAVRGLDKMLDQATMKKLRRYIGKVQAQLGDTKMGAVRYGEAQRDAALLNYNARTGWDNLAGTIFPYQFWYTHSALNWVLRAIDKPGIFSNWARIRMIQERYEREGYPSRLNGKVGIPAPFLPDWMGDTLYVDPMRKIFGFEDMASPFATMAEGYNQETKRAQGILYDWIDDETVDQTEAKKAIETRTGPLWNRAIAQARNEIDAEIENPWDFVSAMMGPSLPIGWAYNAIRGRKDKIGMLPVSRLVRNATSALGIGGPMGFNPEAGIRKVLGMPIGERNEDYYIDRELSNMVADGLIDSDTAIRAMIDRTGEVFEGAQRRVAQFNRVKYIGAPFAVDIFPEGEKEMRALQEKYSAAAEAGQLSAFFDEHPEYESRLALFKEPEQRMRTFLISNIWEWWRDASRLEKNQAKEQFGNVFVDAFIDKETRSYDSIDTQTLAWWARTVKASVPETAPVTPDTPLKMPDTRTRGLIDKYYAEQDRFARSGLFDLQDMYYGLPKEKRKSFLAKNPILKEYWDWRREYIRTNPEVIEYVVSTESQQNAYLDSIGGPSISQAEIQQITGPLQRQLATYWLNGKPLSRGAERELKYILKRSGRAMELPEYLDYLREALTKQ